jgi:hypothetical protein
LQQQYNNFVKKNIIFFALTKRKEARKDERKKVDLRSKTEHPTKPHSPTKTQTHAQLFACVNKKVFCEGWQSFLRSADFFS